jgi:hypothetical protein
LAAVPFVVTTAYTCPSRSLGIVTVLALMGANSCVSPVKKATNSCCVLEADVELNEMGTVAPGTGFLDVDADGNTSGGNALTGRVGFVGGQVVMKDAARLNTWFNERGT